MQVYNSKQIKPETTASDNNCNCLGMA